MSKLKKLISALKGNTNKQQSKPKVQRKRRRAEKEETSESEEDFFDKPEQFKSDFQSFIKVKEEETISDDTKDVSSTISSFQDPSFPCLPLDLSLPIKKESEKRDVKIKSSSTSSSSSSSSLSISSSCRALSKANLGKL